MPTNQASQEIHGRFQVGPVCRILARAALAAVHAPSVLNTQPWHWRIDHDTALLFADQRRRLDVIDADGRLLTLSCGAALHHACATLAAEGAEFDVDPLPDAGRPDLMAVVRYRGSAPPSDVALRLHDAIALRRSDRRPFAGTPVPEDAIERLRHAAERIGANLHMTYARDLGDVAAAAGQAASALLGDPRYRAELAEWVRRPGEGSDGVPLDTAAPPGLRPVPLRDFAATGYGGGLFTRYDLADREARYGILVTNGDGPRDWLIAGVALSSVLLTATAEHLGTSAMSDLVESEVARGTLRRMVGGVGYPQIGVRIGVPAPGEPPKAPRRPAADVVEVVADLSPG